jgi:hypothetical protein
MKRILVLCCAAAVLVLAGCDPFGTDETSAYVTGMIYTDSSWTTGAEDVTVFMTGDSVNTFNQSTVTDANGMFFIEIQLYPSPGGEGSEGFVMPEFAKLGLAAYNEYGSYVYADIKSNPLTIQVGDTLLMWPITMPTAGNGE